MSRDPRLGRRQSRGGPYGLGGLGGYSGPGGPAKSDGALVSRRTLLRMGGALTIAVIGGGTSELLLHTIGSTDTLATATPPQGLPPGSSEVGAMRSLRGPGIPSYADIGGPSPASTEKSRTTGTTATTETRHSAETTPTTTVEVSTKATRGAAHGGSAPTKYFGPSTDRQVYVTIDDGYFPDNRVVDLIKSEHLPITTFLIAEAASEHLGFWRAFVSAGGQIQNHSYSHPDLTTLSQGAAESQWARANKSFASWFGRSPTIGRPPYGAIDQKVALAAKDAGLEAMIMWSALDDGDGIQTWDKGPIAPGSIILLHWTPGLYSDLTKVLKSIDDHHLVPAFLTKA